MPRCQGWPKKNHYTVMLPQVFLLSAALIVVEWSRLRRTLGPWTGVGIPGEAVGVTLAKRPINFMKMTPVLGWSSVLRNWTQGN